MYGDGKGVDMDAAAIWTAIVDDFLTVSVIWS